MKKKIGKNRMKKGTGIEASKIKKTERRRRREGVGNGK